MNEESEALSRHFSTTNLKHLSSLYSNGHSLIHVKDSSVAGK